MLTVVVVVQRKSHLVEVVLTTCPVRRFSNLLHGGEEQRDQDTNNGDHHQQFDQRKTV